MSPERSGSPQEQASTPKMSVPGSPVAGTPPRDAESPISLLLAVAQCQNSRANDDDLTSLSWLHERDVLKGINLVNPSPSSSVHTTPVKASTLSPTANSPTSDYVDESLESTPDSSNGSVHSPTPYHNNNNINGGPGRVKHPHNVPYDPMIHTTSKPPYSFSSLIFMAIEDSEQKALPVKEIYAWIVDHFPYFKNAPNGWKNSVRHNLSLNKSFQKVEKAPNLGKGSLWTVHSPSRPSLVQQLTRSPFHPCSTLDPAIYNKPTTFDKGIYYRLPNPELFPYLSRSLAENGLKQETKMEATSDDSLDAVDAATVMLSLRNGPRHQSRKSKSFQIITNSPSEDHTYSAIENVIVSPDISFESDEEKYSTSKSFICRKIDFEDEEERKIQEGAETLLNLAGITTKKRFSTHSIDFTNSKRKKVNHFVVPANTTEKPTLFRPRLLRAKRKDKISNNNNNNNNNKFSSIQDDWARHRREMEEKKKR